MKDWERSENQKDLRVRGSVRAERGEEEGMEKAEKD